MKSIFILHEGNNKNTNDNKLIRLLINHLNLDSNKIDFHGMGSKSNFFKTDKYKLFKQAVHTNQIEKILFIIDADNIENDAQYGGYENTQTALNDVINQLGFQKVSRTYVVCDPVTQTGYLESFILSTISETQRKCIECFLECSQFKSKENHKAILNQIYNIAYPDAPYNFEHSYFESLKAELKMLFT